MHNHALLARFFRIADVASTKFSRKALWVFITVLFGFVGTTLGANHIVNVNPSNFSPQTLNIVVGDSVTWVSQDDLDSHTVQSDNGKWNPITLVDFGDQFTVVFNSTGTNPYHDVPNGFTGTIIVAAANTPPTVGIISPTNNAVFISPATFTVYADATDSDGSITNVQFLLNTNSLGTDTTSLYSATANSIAAGTYTLFAIATDNLGVKATNSISLVINFPPPSGLIATVKSSSEIDLRWQNNAPNGYQLYVGRSVTSGGPYHEAFATNSATNYNFRGLAPGTMYFFVVRVRNLNGSTTSSEVSATTFGGGTPFPVADSFNPSPDYYISSAAAQTDRKIVICGSFTNLGSQVHSFLGRLNIDGSADATFNPAINSYVNCIAIQTDGKIVIGGNFTTVNGQPRSRIARLNVDGTLDAAFNPGNFPAISVGCLLIQSDGKIVAGATDILHRLNSNGVFDTALDAGVGSVFSIALQEDGKIVAFGSVSPLLRRINTNGTRDQTFSVSFLPKSDGPPMSLAILTDKRILFGSIYNYLIGINTNGSYDATLGPNIDGTAASLALQADGKIVTAGLFNNLGGQSRRHIGRINNDGVTIDNSFTPGADSGIRVFLQPDGKILCWGDFEILGGQRRNFMGRLNNTEPATESLVVTNSQIVWSRGGTAPELSWATFEHSTNGTTWNMLGNASRTNGEWRLSGVFPNNAVIRARGLVSVSGVSSWIAESIGPTALIPPAPSALTANPVSSSQINLTWIDNSTNETRFAIGRSAISGGPYTDIATLPANSTNYSSTNLSAATTYFFVVRATNSFGGSANSAQASVTTFPFPPAAPTGLAAIPISASEIGLSWTDNSTNETGFIIKRSTSSGGPYTNIAALSSNSTSYTNASLAPTNTYFFVVCATNSGGISLNSLEATATTLAPLTNSQVLALWNFNSMVADANTGTGTLTPAIGPGVCSTIGGVSATFFVGGGIDTNSDNSALWLSSYPATNAGNKTAGAQFRVSTVGKQNIVIRWDQHANVAASKYSRLQYSTNGTTFVDLPGAISAGTTAAFEAKTNSLSAIPAVQNNSNFTFRIVTEWQSTATGSGTAGYVAAGTGSSYNSGGTIRYDMVTVLGEPMIVTNPAGTLTLASIGTNQLFRFTIEGSPNSKYVIQSSTNLIDWASLVTNTAPFTFSDTNTPSFRQRFYRAVYLP